MAIERIKAKLSDTWRVTYATILPKKMTVLQKLSLQKVSTTKGIGNKRYQKQKVLIFIFHKAGPLACLAAAPGPLINLT